MLHEESEAGKHCETQETRRHEFGYGGRPCSHDSGYTAG
jgi:hypothetical protein